MHFVQGIDSDPLKLQFLKSIQQIADTCRSHIIAEGVETEAELAVIRDLGIPFGQGYLIGRPSAAPAQAAPDNVLHVLRQQEIAIYPETLSFDSERTTPSISLFDLAPRGVCLAVPVTRHAGELLPHHFTHHRSSGWYIFCCTCRRTGRCLTPGRYPARCPMVFGLSSFANAKATA